MDIKKLAPWNWFKDEEATEGRSLPIVRSAQGFYPLGQLHHEIDRLFENVFRNFGFPSLRVNGDEAFEVGNRTQLRPSVDVAVTDREYTISVEVAGVDEKDIKLELLNDSLVIKGEKRQENERNEKNYYRVERSYGAFQRVLSLPEDVDQESINAKFSNGVLTIILARKAIPTSKGKVIEIRRAA